MIAMPIGAAIGYARMKGAVNILLCAITFGVECFLMSCIGYLILPNMFSSVGNAAFYSFAPNWAAFVCYLLGAGVVLLGLNLLGAVLQFVAQKRFASQGYHPCRRHFNLEKRPSCSQTTVPEFGALAVNDFTGEEDCTATACAAMLVANK